MGPRSAVHLSTLAPVSDFENFILDVEIQNPPTGGSKLMSEGAWK